MSERNQIVIIGSASSYLNALVSQLSLVGAKAILQEQISEAKKQIATPKVGMVIVDLEGVEEGLELIRELNFLFRGMPILAAAVKGNLTEAREAISLGAADFLHLPVDDAKLKSVIKSYCSQFFDPELGRGRKIITNDPGMARLLGQIRRVARSQASVLIQGESGTGKELIARFVHQVSDRASGPFVAINCAALPENLLESELFGHIKGAFTGATSDRKGKFLQANGGTIFLDEISEMTLNLQAKMLRVLQEREVDPVGGKSAISVDVRVVASTNRELKAYAEEGNFREDLYYRLNVFPVQLPPLRERGNDVLLLSESFRTRFVAELARNDIPFSKRSVAVLNRYQWPGNVRELENVIQRALLMAEGEQIEPADLMIDIPAGFDSLDSSESPNFDVESGGAGFELDSDLDDEGIRLPVGTTVRQMEEILIHRTLNEVNGNRTRAAELLGISIRTLRNKLNEYATR
ncbi:MAG: sigma-54-dependent Fis family transcriptional regulator [Magnetococcales bacterium]|nr:sigma-54-dependent Fis family transcriptional regulator [Magnetococcales bacterium]